MAKSKTRPDGRVMKKVFTGTVDGVKKYKFVYGRTDAEAERKAREIRRRLDAGERIQAGDVTFRVWAERLLSLKRDDLSPSYVSGLESRCRFWNARVGDLAISEVLTSDIQDGINALYTKGRAKKTLTDYRNTAEAILELAERDRAITYNPARFVDVPRNAKRSTRFALTTEEQEWIRTTPHRAQLAAMVMMYAGLRRGELLALNISDIDWGEGVIHVTKAVQFMSDGNTPQIKRGGKTDAATRTVPIPDILADTLRQGTKGRSPFEVLICGKDGKHMTEATFSRMWSSYLSVLNEEHGQPIGTPKRSRFSPGGIPMTIRNITPHCLRHTYATILHAAGVDVLTAQKLLGHSDVKTTLSIYTHLDDATAKKDISKLNQFLSANIGDAKNDAANDE